jgi:hypothetical protein
MEVEGKSDWIEDVVANNKDGSQSENRVEARLFRWNSVVITDPNGVLIYDTLDQADRLTQTHETFTYIIDPLDERVAVIRPFLGNFGAGAGANANADVDAGAGTSVNDEPETVARALSRIFDELMETWNTRQKLLPTQESSAVTGEEERV